jgi:hypothetical protein
MPQDTMPALSGLDSFEQLENLLGARRLDGSPEAAMTFEAFEVELAQVMRRFENELKAADLARYDVDAETIMVNGQLWRQCLANQPKTYLSASGPITVSRNLYRPAGGGKSICPLELNAGIIGGLHTPVLARQVAYLMGHLTSEETSQVFGELGIEGPLSSTCDRLPKRLSEAWEAHRVQWENALREQEWVEAETAVVAVSLDGVMVPDKDGQREAKAKREAAKAEGLSRAPSGPAGYREVGCGTVTLYDEEGHRLGTVRYGRAPESKKKTLTAQLDAELSSILAVRPDLSVVAIADGAEENWRYFDRPLYDNATRIVDHGHACEHLREAMSAYYGDKNIEGRAQYARFRIVLRDQVGGVDEVITELGRLSRRLRGKRHKARRKRLRSELTYFQNQRGRMAYADYQTRGLPIGSGVVEAACKTLATQRLKRSGMSWRGGKQAILTIRSLQQSQRWPAAWALLSAHFRVTILVVRQRGHLKELTPVKMAV